MDVHFHCTHPCHNCPCSNASMPRPVAIVRSHYPLVMKSSLKLEPSKTEPSLYQRFQLTLDMLTSGNGINICSNLGGCFMLSVQSSDGTADIYIARVLTHCNARIACAEFLDYDMISSKAINSYIDWRKQQRTNINQQKMLTLNASISTFAQAVLQILLTYSPTECNANILNAATVWLKNSTSNSY